MPFDPPPPTAEQRAELAASAGLCASCRHLQVLESQRSRFVRCALSEHDPAFPRYPPLPRLECAGYRTHRARPD